MEEVYFDSSESFTSQRQHCDNDLKTRWLNITSHGVIGDVKSLCPLFFFVLVLESVKKELVFLSLYKVLANLLNRIHGCYFIFFVKIFTRSRCLLLYFCTGSIIVTTYFVLCFGI